MLIATSLLVTAVAYALLQALSAAEGCTKPLAYQTCPGMLLLCTCRSIHTPPDTGSIAPEQEIAGFQGCAAVHCSRGPS